MIFVHKLFAVLVIASLSIAAQADIASLLNQEVKIINVNSSKALTVPGMSTENGASVIQYEYLGNADQKWKIESASNGNYRILNLNSNKALEIADQGLENGDVARQWNYFDVPHHQWKITSLGGGIYSLINVNSDKALEIADGDTENNAVARQWAYFDVPHHQWQITLAATQSAETVLQAEDAVTTGGQVVADSSAQGGGYFDLLTDGRVDFQLSTPTAGNYKIDILYRSPYGGKIQTLLKNNEVIAENDFAQSGDWQTTSVVVELDAGTTTFSIQANWGYTRIDQISFAPEGASPPPSSERELLEAENAVFTGDISINDARQASNGSYLTLGGTGSFTLSTSLANSGDYELKFGFSNRDEKRQHLYINDTFIQEVTFPGGYSWNEVSVPVYLESGKQDIKIEASWGYTNFDYIKVLPKGAKEGPTLYYDYLGTSIDYIERYDHETYTAPGGSPSPYVDRFVGLKNGDWVIEIQWNNTAQNNYYLFNLSTGQATKDDQTIEPTATGDDLKDYINILQNMNLPRFVNVSNYVSKVIEALEQQ